VERQRGLPHRPRLTYEVCAYDNSVRTAWLDASRGFFNGTSLCLRVQGKRAAPCTLDMLSRKNSGQRHLVVSPQACL
jgi:predicted metalloprotease with PDZ domain